MKFIVIPRITFRGANAQPSWWIVGPPGPMPILGFSLALCRAIGIQSDFAAAGAVLHDYCLRAESGEYNASLPHQQRGAALIDNKDYASGTQSLSAQPTARCDGIVSVVIGVSDHALIDNSAIVDFLDRGRIAGGTIARHGFIGTKTPSFNSLADAQKHIKGGFSMVDRSDLLTPRGAEDPLDAFLRVTRYYKVATKEECQPESWLAPYAAGYIALNTPVERPGTRDNLPHAFAEPVIGLMQFVSRNAAPVALWRYATEPGQYLIEPLTETTVTTPEPQLA